jgi:hypothetical protein
VISGSRCGAVPARRFLPLLAVLVLAGCGRMTAERPGWVIHSRLLFLSDDLTQERAPLPPEQFRLVFRYIAGDLYGPPTTGDFVRPALGPQYGFELDLNPSHEALLASLEKTDFSLSYLRIEPAGARVARLAPELLEADGIEQVGRLEWFDPRARRTLMLLYLDRPASITGRYAAGGGRPVRYSIRTTAPDYVWVGRESNADEDVYTVVTRPTEVVLAVRPAAGGAANAAPVAATQRSD